MTGQNGPEEHRSVDDAPKVFAPPDLDVAAPRVPWGGLLLSLGLVGGIVLLDLGGWLGLEALGVTAIIARAALFIGAATQVVIAVAYLAVGRLNDAKIVFAVAALFGAVAMQSILFLVCLGGW